MNKKVIVGVVIVGILLLVGWFLMSGNKNSKKVGQTDNNPVTSTSLKDLITKNISQTCTFSSEGSNGTVYINSGKVRGDFDTTTGDKPVKSHMLVLDSTSYIWTEGQNTGFKMAFDPNATPVPGANNTSKTAESIDPNLNNNYKCSTGVIDQTKFELPADVTFNSFTIPAPQMQAQPDGKGATDISPSSCSYCNALTGDDKTQCLIALKCN